MSTATTPAVLDPDDLCVWADGTACPASELPDYTHMSDDYERIPYGTDRWTSESEKSLWYGN